MHFAIFVSLFILCQTFYGRQITLNGFPNKQAQDMIIIIYERYLVRKYEFNFIYLFDIFIDVIDFLQTHLCMNDEIPFRIN